MGTALQGETGRSALAFAGALHKISQGVAVLAFFTSAGCTSLETAGGRPFVYKVGPGDPPSTIHTTGGLIYKEPTPVSPEIAQASTEKPAPAQVARAEVQSPAAAAPAVTAPSTPVASPATAPAAAAPSVTAPAAAATAGAVGASSFDRGYTQASRYGDLLFLSGQIAIDPATGGAIADRSIEAQTRQVMQNIRGILEAHGLTMANVISTQVYLRSINNLTLMDEVYRRFFKGAPPARTVVEVSNLPRGMEVEISAVAGK
jgi:2-iminobutanoate/2-iminopropanoate deaminase